MRIRHYQPGDREQVVALWNQVFPGAAGHNAPNASIDRKVASDDDLFFIAVDDDTVIGTVMAGYDGHRGWLYSVAVDPDRRRCGIGSTLIRHVEQVLKELGCPKLNLQILTDNAEVVAFYRALGFQVEQRISMGKIFAS